MNAIKNNDKLLQCIEEKQMVINQGPTSIFNLGT